MPFTTTPIAIPNAAAPTSSGAAGTNASGSRMTGSAFPSAIAFAVLVGIYLLWALLQQHEKFRDQVQPKNIAFNFHNLFGIFLNVVVALGLVKLLLAVANKFMIPGAGAVSDAVEFAS